MKYRAIPALHTVQRSISRRSRMAVLVALLLVCKHGGALIYSKSISNGFAFFVWQNMEFANSQINMAKVKRINLQRFPIIHLAKTKIVDPHYFPVIFSLRARTSISRGAFFAPSREFPRAVAALPGCLASR